jgi:hypothetical protein
MVLGNTFSLRMHNAEVILGSDIALLGSAPIPFDSLSVVSRDAFAVVVHCPEVGLSADDTLFSGQSVPLHRLRVILGRISTIVVLFADAIGRVAPQHASDEALQHLYVLDLSGRSALRTAAA